ncbi:hypothetical protein DH2020_006407 [Rehmannia glutinosa]|uniref:Uncharacterized protein n=1 Tax=Rehmannia glutinosa TaxID=99300 RepID=A0ABR0XIY0_REHGL
MAADPCNVAGIRSTKPSITHVIFDMDGLLLGSVRQSDDDLLHSESGVAGAVVNFDRLPKLLHHTKKMKNTNLEKPIATFSADTEKFYTEVQEIILARYNKTFDWSLKAKMMGMKAIEAARVFVQETGISDSLSAEEFLVEREDMLRTLFPSSELMPGASRLIQHLHANGIPISVATGSHRRHFELKTQRHGELFSLMHHIVLGDDPEVKQGKPSPDGGPVDPRKILVFEDAPSGVLAAKNAGMSVVMVPDPRLDSSYRETADQVLTLCWTLIRVSGVCLLSRKQQAKFILINIEHQLAPRRRLFLDSCLIDQSQHCLPKFWKNSPIS